LKGDQLKAFRKGLDADLDEHIVRGKSILELHRKGQALIPKKEWEDFVASMRKTGKPPKEKTLWDSPAAQKLVKGLRRKRK
jgi:hypothetical protein